MKTNKPSLKVFELFFEGKKLPRKKKKSVLSYIRTWPVILSYDESASLEEDTISSFSSLMKNLKNLGTVVL
jgi:hypothetical protein